MVRKKSPLRILLLLLIWLATTPVYAHDIYFCGEKIPLDDMVKTKLMNIIKKQINYINIPSIKQNVNTYMHQVEKWLTAFYLPADFKYLPIIESGYSNTAVSSAGAAGFWQIMPGVARNKGMQVDGLVDDRLDFDKSAYVACQLLVENYNAIYKKFHFFSWVLTAAAYNIGIGNISKIIPRQGTNYFTMSLNDETAAYVYKIIAVKELFEYPELYMNNFGYNVFNTVRTTPKNADTSTAALRTINVTINNSTGLHDFDLKQKLREINDHKPIAEISAQTAAKYNNLKDGDNILFVLNNDLMVQNRFTAKGSIIQGRAWIIDDRIYVDLGYDHAVILYDLNGQKGIPSGKIKKNEKVVLRIFEP